MKKLFIFIALLFSMGFLFLSCGQVPIFASIELEVKLKEPSVQGTVRGVCKAGTTLYAANGSVYQKTPGSTGKWSKIGNPVGDALCTSIATDSSVLYASFVGYYSNLGKGVYKYDGSSWSKVSGSDGIQAVMGNGTVFGVKTSFSFSASTLERVESGQVYKISGGSATSLKNLGTYQRNILGTERKNTYVYNIKAAGGNFYATSEGVFDSSGTIISGSPKDVKAIDRSGTYFITENKVYKQSDWTAGVNHYAASPSDAIKLEVAGKTLLLISSEAGGYSEVLIDTSVFGNSSSISIGSESSTTPSSNKAQYNSSVNKHGCNCIYAQTIGSGYFIYLGVNDSNYGKYTGLWGFYKPNQLEWNRE